jgi:phytoene dehydrogenase-like protein
MQSYIIVGGGLAGLTAANALSGNGNRVVLIEAGTHLGGRAATHIEKGYALNAGPHAFYRGGRAFETLRRWNVPFSGNSAVLDYAWFIHQGRKYPFFTSARSFFQTTLFRFAEKIEAARLIAGISLGHAADGETMEQWIARHNEQPPRLRVRGDHHAARDLLGRRGASGCAGRIGADQDRGAGCPLSRSRVANAGGWPGRARPVPAVSRSAARRRFRT